MADTGESDGGWDALRLCCCHGHLDGLTLDEMAAVGAPCPTAAYVAAERDRAVTEALREAIDFAHEEQRRGLAEGRSEEQMTLFVHWSATAGWLSSRIRAIERGDDPNLPDAMRSTRGDCWLCRHVVLVRDLTAGDAPCDECGCLAHYPPWDADEHRAAALRAALPAEPEGTA